MVLWFGEQRNEYDETALESGESQSGVEIELVVIIGIGHDPQEVGQAVVIVIFTSFGPLLLILPCLVWTLVLH